MALKTTTAEEKRGERSSLLFPAKVGTRGGGGEKGRRWSRTLKTLPSLVRWPDCFGDRRKRLYHCHHEEATTWYERRGKGGLVGMALCGGEQAVHLSRGIGVLLLLLAKVAKENGKETGRETKLGLLPRSRERPTFTFSGQKGRRERRPGKRREGEWEGGTFVASFCYSLSFPPSLPTFYLLRLFLFPPSHETCQWFYVRVESAAVIAASLPGSTRGFASPPRRKKLLNFSVSKGERVLHCSQF